MDARRTWHDSRCPSPLLTCAQIFLAFPPSILLYRFVFGYSYFGTLNMMATFIILGIGADGECPPALGLACQPEEGW